VLDLFEDTPAHLCLEVDAVRRLHDEREKVFLEEDLQFGILCYFDRGRAWLIRDEGNLSKKTSLSDDGDLLPIMEDSDRSGVDIVRTSIGYVSLTHDDLTSFFVLDLTHEEKIRNHLLGESFEDIETFNILCHKIVLLESW